MDSIFFSVLLYFSDKNAIKYAKDLDVMEPLFLEAVENFNDTVRSNRDWEKMSGRAVSDD